MKKSYIIVRTQFVGFHCWKEAPMEVGFLKFSHRHIFHVEAKIPVTHDDRQLEFFLVKDFLDTEIKVLFPIQQAAMPYSCEMIASKLLDTISDKYGIKKDLSVAVYEDGENGGMVEI